ncbi:hypothetical protein PMIN01_02662 [Paraphaeosphaeria minitans]|uniref:Uncharacterized protein n=1 Tax=Paraphaeosphaeria minitans TaxID=565426 RepID=A0A9P6GQI0_9PLEO|nr:hypothetical protein PMIN01_02662 [Paraphaeosphaeria minitans]
MGAASRSIGAGWALLTNEQTTPTTWLAQPHPKTHKRHAKVAARHGISIEPLVIHLHGVPIEPLEKAGLALAACGLAVALQGGCTLQTQRPVQSLLPTAAKRVCQISPPHATPSPFVLWQPFGPRSACHSLADRGAQTSHARSLYAPAQPSAQRCAGGGACMHAGWLLHVGEGRRRQTAVWRRLLLAQDARQG